MVEFIVTHMMKDFPMDLYLWEHIKLHIYHYDSSIIKSIQSEFLVLFPVQALCADHPQTPLLPKEM